MSDQTLKWLHHVWWPPARWSQACCCGKSKPSHATFIYNITTLEEDSFVFSFDCPFICCFCKSQCFAFHSVWVLHLPRWTLFYQIFITENEIASTDPWLYIVCICFSIQYLTDWYKNNDSKRWSSVVNIPLFFREMHSDWLVDSSGFEIEW